MTDSNPKFIVHNPDFRENILEHLKRQEFMKHIDCRLVTIEPGYIVADMLLRKFHEQQSGFIHGGVIATIADVATGFAAFTLVHKHQQPVTVEIKTSFLEPAIGTNMKAKGYVVRQGRSLYFCEATIECIDNNGSEKICARASATMAVVDIQKGCN